MSWLHLYNYKWKKYRKAFIADNPWCSCGRPAKVVDHVTPHKGNVDLFWDESNHRARCKSCHDSKTASRDGGFGNLAKKKHEQRKVSGACGINGLPLDPLHHWNKR